LSERRGCFKAGCLGCGGLAVLAVVILVVLLAVGFLTGGRESRMEDIERSQPVSTARPAPPAAGGTIDHEIEVAEPGRIVLDLNRGNFEIVAGAEGESLRVEGRYDAGKFDLAESYETYGETGWIYRLEFDQRGTGLQPFVEHEESRNLVRLVVPPGVPIRLEGRVGIGQSHLRLGGLWLTDVDLEVGIGEHRVSFDEPLPVPVGRIRLDTSIGVLRVDRLGNASPSDVQIKHSMGETRVDLGGHWRRDAELFVSCGIGSCVVDAPDAASLKLERVGVAIGESRVPRRPADTIPGAPTLTLSVSGTIGEVRLR